MDFDNISLVDIFKKEAECQGILFEEAMLKLIENPETIGMIDTIMRAAHSMKGAAQIVGLKTVSHIAHLIEDCFVAMQKTNMTLSREDLSFMLKVFDILVKIKDLNEKDMFDWPTGSEGLVREFEVRLLDIRQKLSAYNEEAVNEKFLDLFKIEFRANLLLLDELLSKNIQNKDITDTVVRIPHSIKGAAGIVGFTKLGKLAEKIEYWFLVIKDHNSIWEDEATELLRDCVDVLKKIEAVPKHKMGVLLIEMELNLLQLIDRIEHLVQKNKQGDKKKINTFCEDTLDKNLNDGVIAISADNLNRMMSLSAELLVQLRQFKMIKDVWIKIKNHDLHLSGLLDKALEDLHTDQGNLEKTQLLLKEARGKLQDSVHQVWKGLGYFDELMERTNTFSENLYQTVLLNCMAPFAQCVQSLPRLVYDLSQKLDKRIVLDILGKETLVDRHLIKGIKNSLTHIIRNACDHGIQAPEDRLILGKRPEGMIVVKAYHHSGLLVIEVTDDGKGVHTQSLRHKIVQMGLLDEESAKNYPKHKLLDFLFLPRFSTAEELSDISGRGVGLDVVHDFVEQEGGSVRIMTEEGQGTTFLLQLPIMRSILKTLVTKIHIGFYAFPMISISCITKVDLKDIIKNNDLDGYVLDGQFVPIVYLGEILGIPYKPYKNSLRVVVVSGIVSKYALIVDDVCGESNLVVRPLDIRLGKVSCVSAVSLTQEGEPVFILDMDDILELLNKNFAQKTKRHRVSKPKRKKEKGLTKELLWVDDSDMILKNGIQLLTESGYNVTTAMNGQKALEILNERNFDLVITDLDMPELSGEELIQSIRSREHTADIPILVVSSRAMDDTSHTLFKGNYLNKKHIGDHDFLLSIQTLLN